MELEITGVETSDRHLSPTIEFEVEVEFRRYDEALMVLDGRLEGAGNTILSPVHEWGDEARRGDFLRDSKLGSHPDNINQDYGNGDDQSFTTKVFAPLGAEGVEYLEKQRDRDQRGDVYLKILLEVGVLRDQTKLTGVHEVKPKKYSLEEIQPAGGHERILTRERRLENKGEMNFLEPRDVPAHMEVGRTVLRGQTQIASNEWIQDYAPSLGVGDRLVVELPDPDDMSGVSEDLQEAIIELGHARDELRRGEWSHCVRLIQNNVLELVDPEKGAEELWEMEDVGYSSPAQGALRGLNDAFKNYLGKFRHRRSRPPESERMPRTDARREDAYFMYVTAAGLVQLLARKEERRQTDS